LNIANPNVQNKKLIMGLEQFPKLMLVIIRKVFSFFFGNDLKLTPLKTKKKKKEFI